MESSDPNFLFTASGGAGCHKIDITDKSNPMILTTWKNDFAGENSVENIYLNKNMDVLFAGVRFYGLAIINAENMEEINKI